MKYFIAFLFAIGFVIMVTINPVNALLVSSDPLGEVDVAVVGKIVSATPNYDAVETEYVAEIEEIIKGWGLLEKGNSTKSIQFTSPGIMNYDGSGPIYKKIFNIGDRALLMVNQKNGGLYESLWSRVTTSDCSGSEIAQLHYAPGGLFLSQHSHDGSPFYTNEPITAKFYYFNKELTNKTINIEFVVIDDFPDVYHSENVTLSLKRCQPYAEALTEFTMLEPSTFAIRAIVGDNEGGSQSYSGIEVLDYVLPPLKQLHSGISPDKVVCKADLELVHKRNGLAACVTPETREKLIQRNWAIDFPMEYIIGDRYWSQTYLVHHTMCAHIGVEKISEEEAIHRFFWTMTDDDLEKIPIIKSMLEYNSHGLYSSDEYPITSTVVPDDVQNQYRQILEELAYDEIGSWMFFFYDGKHYATVFSIC